ncbi:MAG TPA: hypothetical protein DD734_02000, partial [Firmicutes bacterium]|nr:hypothetical protein [Bacillota bacterium]
MRYLLFAAEVILVVALLFLVFINFGGLDFRLNEIVIVDDSAEVFKLIEKNTPLRLEINDERWGQAVLEDPQVLFAIWEV